MDGSSGIRAEAPKKPVVLIACVCQIPLPPSTLSALLNGRRNPGVGLERQIRASLTGESQIAAKNSRFLKLTLDEFSLFSDSRHYAFLELLSLKDFHSDIQWAAAKLGVRVNEAKALLRRLQQAGLLRIEDGTWLDATGGYVTNLDPKTTSAAARKQQKQLLEYSKLSVDQDAYESRNHTSVTFAVRQDRLEQAKGLIAEFRRSFSQLLASERDGDEVYTLQVSLFPMTKAHKLTFPGGNT